MFLFDINNNFPCISKVKQALSITSCTKAGPAFSIPSKLIVYNMKILPQ